MAAYETWCDTGRTTYWAPRGGVPFEVGGRANPRREEFERMEKWKEENCKVCPRCSRVIEKLEGCDMMTCGTDTHRGEGANRQNGCGHEFLWSQAQPYKRNQAPAAIPEDGVVPEEGVVDGVVGAVRDFACRLPVNNLLVVLLN